MLGNPAKFSLPRVAPRHGIEPRHGLATVTFWGMFPLRQERRGDGPRSLNYFMNAEPEVASKNPTQLPEDLLPAHLITPLLMRNAPSCGTLRDYLWLPRGVAPGHGIEP